MDRLCCPCCLAPGKLDLRFDKLSRPYGVCISCGVKLFFRGTQSLVGLAHLSPVAEALATKISTDRDEWARLQATRRTVETWMAQARSPETAGNVTNAAMLPGAAAIGGAR